MFGESSKGCKVLRLCGCLQRTSCLRYKSSTWKFEDLENSGRPINVQLPTSLCPKVACVVGPLKCSNQASKPNHTSGEKWLAKDAQGPNHIGEKWPQQWHAQTPLQSASQSTFQKCPSFLLVLQKWPKVLEDRQVHQTKVPTLWLLKPRVQPIHQVGCMGSRKLQSRSSEKKVNIPSVPKSHARRPKPKC